MKSDEMIIRPMIEEDIAAIGVDRSFPWASVQETKEKWNQYYKDQENGIRIVGIVEKGRELLGYGSLHFKSQYAHFNKIPEIHDLWIYKEHRKKGIGSLLIAWLETLAKEKGYKQIGIGVGLYADYGSAQRLYAQLGYIPDGRGITYKYQPTTPGQDYTLDDDLILWMKKNL